MTQKLHVTSVIAVLCFFGYGLPSTADEPKHPQFQQESKVSDSTECRAGCQGNTSGCQESWKTAVLSATPGWRLYRSTLTISRKWPGSDTTPLAAEPRWIITSEPAGSERPISITIRPDVASCDGTDGDRQSRTHYEWTAVQGR
jgi:hypothetical protein